MLARYHAQPAECTHYRRLETLLARLGSFPLIANSYDYALCCFPRLESQNHRRRPDQRSTLVNLSRVSPRLKPTFHRELYPRVLRSLASSAFKRVGTHWGAPESRNRDAALPYHVYWVQRKGYSRPCKVCLQTIRTSCEVGERQQNITDKPSRQPRIAAVPRSRGLMNLSLTEGGRRRRLLGKGQVEYGKYRFERPRNHRGILTGGSVCGGSIINSFLPLPETISGELPRRFLPRT